MGGWILGALLAVAAVLFAWGWFEAGWLRRRVVEIELEGVSPELDGVRIAHLSDLHLGVPSRGRRSVEDAVAWVVERRPDLVCITGDLVSRRRGMPLLERLLGELGPCYVVLGNHDYADSRDPFSQRIDPAAIDALDGVVLLGDESVERRASRATRADRWRRSTNVCGARRAPTRARRPGYEPENSPLPLPGNRATQLRCVSLDPRGPLPRRADRRPLPGRRASSRAPQLS